MGLISVEKCLFYLAVKTQKYSRPEDADYGKSGVRHSFEIRTVRLPWEGGTAKTIGYIHDTQINSGGRQVGTSTSAMRDYVLGVASGRTVWKHPSIIVADVPKPTALMSGKDLGNILLKRLQAKGGIAAGVMPHPVKPRLHEIWLPWDPTLPGMRFASMETAKRYASQVLDKPLGKVYSRASRTRTTRTGATKVRRVQIGRDGGHNPDVYTPLGVGFRLTYHEVAPPDVVWNDRISKRIREHMANIGVPDGEEWYGIGEFIPEDHMPNNLIQRYRGQGFQTYTPGRGVTRTDPDEDRVLRRIAKVTARNHDEAQQKIQVALDRAKNTAHRLEALRRETAWSRTGNRVISASAFNTTMRSQRSRKRRSFVSTRVSLPVREDSLEEI
jgi:hypothetical protein